MRRGHCRLSAKSSRPLSCAYRVVLVGLVLLVDSRMDDNVKASVNMEAEFAITKTGEIACLEAVSVLRTLEARVEKLAADGEDDFAIPWERKLLCRRLRFRRRVRLMKGPVSVEVADQALSGTLDASGIDGAGGLCGELTGTNGLLVLDRVWFEVTDQTLCGEDLVLVTVAEASSSLEWAVALRLPDLVCQMFGLLALLAHAVSLLFVLPVGDAGLVVLVADFLEVGVGGGLGLVLGASPGEPSDLSR